MRILDCKSPVCSKIAQDAPVILDYLCDDCNSHFTALQSHLQALHIDFTINPKIVRGLDYYTKTVFEFVTTDIGAQGTVCGGGRYDGLIAQLGGPETPALGFGMGIERLMLTMQQQGCEFLQTPPCDLYIAPMDAEALPKAMQLAQVLRQNGYQTEYDLMHRGLKAQMKYANKIHAAFVLVLGGNELEQQSAKLKQMETGEQFPLPLDDGFAEAFDSIYVSHMFENTLQDFKEEK
jgi:histidyl-tRNA synthetase